MRKLLAAGLALPPQLQSQLKLPWIIRRSRLTSLREERINCLHLELVNEVKHVHTPTQVQALPTCERTAHAHIVEKGHRHPPGIPGKRAVDRHKFAANDPPRPGSSKRKRIAYNFVYSVMFTLLLLQSKSFMAPSLAERARAPLPK
jgi:hypothetical protein